MTRSLRHSPATLRPPAAAVFSRFTVELHDGDVPDIVRDAAALHLLDTLGCGLAAHALGVAGQAQVAAAEDGGARQATAIGVAERVPAHAAALANGMLCHGLDFDDTHTASICHISAVVCPAALAAGEAAGATGRDVITAIVAGTELVAAIGEAAAPSYMRTGFHPTGVCGVFGAAAAAARLRKLSAPAAASALGIAGSMASGLFEYLADGSETKPIHAGWAAHGGVVAARLADAGATGPPTVLEGRFGLFSTYYNDPKPELTRGLGKIWETPRVAVKAYPACHFVHSCLDAAAGLRAAHAVQPEDITEVVVSIPAPGVPLVLEPRDAKIAPRTPYDAKFSLPYSVATMLVRGRVNLASYTESAIADPQVLALAERVRYEPRDFPTFPAAFPGSVSITTLEGTFRAEVPHQRGGPENSMTTGEVREKFRENAALALADADVERLESAVLGLDAAPDLDEMGILRAAQGGSNR